MIFLFHQIYALRRLDVVLPFQKCTPRPSSDLGTAKQDIRIRLEPGLYIDTAK
jgi:hypothetical protein